MEAMKQNMVWDGLFHAGTCIMTALGVCLLWDAGRARQLPASALRFTRATNVSYSTMRSAGTRKTRCLASN
jgi:uncharacterized membrane protein